MAPDSTVVGPTTTAVDSTNSEACVAACGGDGGGDVTQSLTR